MANFLQQLFCEHSYKDYREEKVADGQKVVETGQVCEKCGKKINVKTEAVVKPAAKKAAKKTAPKAAKKKTAKKSAGKKKSK